MSSEDIPLPTPFTRIGMTFALDIYHAESTLRPSTSFDHGQPTEDPSDQQNCAVVSPSHSENGVEDNALCLDEKNLASIRNSCECSPCYTHF